MIDAAERPSRWPVVEEIRKLPAFLRRDFLVAWTYRLAFVVDWLNLFGQILVFSLVGRLIDPSTLPVIGGEQVTYVEFVVTGIAVTTLLQISLGRVVAATREEQLMGTLEALLMTPTSQWTIQVGLVVYDLVYVPIRTLGIVLIAVLLFDASIHASGLGPAIAILLVFMLFAWGVGMLGAALVLTFRRGVNVLTFATSIVMIGSNAYVPVDVLPSWAAWIAVINPVTFAIDGVRGALLGGGGWQDAVDTIVILLPIALISLIVGVVSIKLALARERRRGTLGLY
ncbi:MAG: ABC transporter permease [Acidobacteria bacterium]|jgi:ABC-2 type transport system permease protein|nr:MAG: ABC transporter permease [Acidobacteriota bacterium]